MNFVHDIPQQYRGAAPQRQLLTDAVQQWSQSPSRQAVLANMGIDLPQMESQTPRANTVKAIAQKLDLNLVRFLLSIPKQYQALAHQRQTLLRLYQQWHGLKDDATTISHLQGQLQTFKNQKPKPLSPFQLQPPSAAPLHWTPDN
ncbi:MAG: hypothetical protein HC796_09725, partial [Synechococcaceae cyanobacterium RL_1_2]|nr:hypothetical protein [Synechococcaceae cyanobacterium RL_1_2]